MYFNISIKLISFEVVFIELLNSITINYIFMGVMNPRKESIMTNTINNAAINPATNKEEMDMKKRAIIIVDGDERIETTLDAMSLEELLDMKELTKDIIRAYLEEEGIKYSNTLFNKTKRVELIHELFDIMHPVNNSSAVISVIAKNRFNDDIINESCREFATFAEAQNHAEYLAAANSVISVSIINGTETIIIKEDTIMKENNTPVTNNNKNIKEETTMKNTDLATRTLNMNKVERLVYVRDNILNITKTTDELYIKKEELVKFLFDNDIISRYPSKNELSKTKRQEFVDILMTVVQNLIDAKVIIPVNAVPVGDLDITNDNAPAPQPVVQEDSKAKTDKLFALIKAYAADNQKKGYGYTISSFMLQACILEAGAGVKKFKGHKITEEESKMTHNVYKWLKDKGFIKPVVYSVVEDPNVRIYLDSYTGRTDSPKTKLIPFSKSNGYTAKQVTSFTVIL